MNRAAEAVTAAVPADAAVPVRPVELEGAAPESLGPEQARLLLGRSPADPGDDVPARPHFAGGYRPRDLLALQRLAGNGAVSSLVRRGIAPHAPAPGTVQREPAPTMRLQPARLKRRKPTSQPLVIDNLVDAVDRMPLWLSALKGGRRGHLHGSDHERGATDAEEAFELEFGNVTLFARDAIYYFTADGALLAVDTNLKAADPAHPDQVPPALVALPLKSTVMALDPASGKHGQVVSILATSQLVIALERDAVAPVEGAVPGSWQLLAYAPDRFASKDGGPQPGFVSKAEPVRTDDAPDKPDPAQPPRAAEAQLERVRTLLEEAADNRGEGGAEGDSVGTGTGLSGTGPGGGGADRQGTGTGATGRGTGKSRTAAGTGRAGDPVRPRDRAKPDKVVMWMGKKRPGINVWAAGAAESIPFNDGETDASLLQRIEEAAARLLSTGKRLADGGADNGFLFGHGGGQPSEEDLAEATSLTANATAYPSKISMQGGSGDEVSPKGWATTIGGADHDFDMVLDWDAIQFGITNQTFARLGWISYVWEVVDVSRVPIDATKKDSARAGARDAAHDTSNVRKPSKLENFKSVGHTVEAEGEGIEADAPTFKLSDGPTGWAANAGELAVEGISATWNIAKGLVSAWIAKVTQPENRQTIHLKEPGEYVIRCLANPYVNSDKPEAQRTIRATSIAAFPVRVLEVDTRAREVNRSEATEITGLEKALAQAQAELDGSPGDPGKQAAVDLLANRLSGKKKEAARTTTQKLADDSKGLNDEFAALNQLIASGGKTDDLSGDILAAAMRIKNEEGLLAPWQWDMRRQDVDKALAAKIDQAKQAGTWSRKYLKDASEEIRPQVTFVSEENGSVVRMAMILGPAEGTSDEHPKWVLLDVTSPSTQGKYFGTSRNPGAAGHAEAIAEAFKEFSEKGEYGRGTIAISLPRVNATGGTPVMPDTMLMRPGRFDRWMKRLQSIVEIAGLVAPFVEGGALAEVAAVGGAAESGYHMYERVVADRFHANFETLTDIMGVLTPFISGAKALAELEGMASTKSGYVLKVAARGGELVNEYIVPISVFHDLDQVMADKAMGGPEKQASVAMILGRAMRDKILHLAGENLSAGRQGPWEAEEAVRRPARDPDVPVGAHSAPTQEPPAGAATGAPPGRLDAPGSEPGHQTAVEPIAEPEPGPRPKAEPKPELGPEPEPEPGHGGGPVGGGGGGGGAGGGGGPEHAGDGDGPAGAWVAGMRPGAVEGIKELTTHYHITIDLRPPTVYARSRLAEGAVPKPVEIKAKTINRADILLGAPEGALGLVGYFEPKRPARPKEMEWSDWKEVVRRYQDRLQEYDDLAYDMHRRVKDGTIRITDGLVRLREPRGPEGGPERYRPVTGDVDLYQIHWANGEPMTTAQADIFAGELRKWGIGVEHGAHLRWKPRNEHEQKVYDKVVAAHDPGKAALLRFEPGEEPQRVDNATPITVRPGQSATVEVVHDPANEPAGGGPGGEGPGTGGPGPEGGAGPGTGGPGHGAKPIDSDARPTLATDTRVVPQGADLEPNRAPSIPKGAEFQKQPAGRFVPSPDKPAQGISEGEIVIDTTTGRKHLFKPSNKEIEVPRARERGILAGDYAPRAKASELVATELGLFTPHVELVVINGRKGSLTEWVEQISLQELTKDRPRFDALTRSPEFQRARDVIEAFDYLVNNVDRVNNKGNYLVEFKPDGSFGRLIPIDHDLTFTSSRARAQITEFASGLPKAYSAETKAALEKLQANRDAFKESIRPLVGDEAIEGFVQRLDELVADARLSDARSRQGRP